MDKAERSAHKTAGDVKDAVRISNSNTCLVCKRSAARGDLFF